MGALLVGSSVLLRTVPAGAAAGSRPWRDAVMTRRYIPPGPGQESVWDYPRPPRLEETRERLRVAFGGETIAETRRGLRLLETSHPPVFYFPPEDVRTELLAEAPRRSFCEFKGSAVYWDIVTNGRRATEAAWNYPDPQGNYSALQGYFAFYAAEVDGCWVGDERVQPQAGDFYGGWITSRIVGPFKGGPGTFGW